MKFARIQAFFLLLCVIFVALRVGWAQAPAPSSRSLDGVWQLLPDQGKQWTPSTLPASGWRPVRVPLAIQMQFPDLRDFAGAAWYRRTFTAPVLVKGDHLLIHFAAVDYACKLWINGTPVGEHQGGYTPFSFDLTGLTHPGTNQLLLRISDPPGPPSGYRASMRQIPHGKQTWYVGTSGIWQPVTLEVEPPYFIRWVHALTRGSDLTGFQLSLAHPGRIPAGAFARVVVSRPGMAPVARSVALPSGTALVTLPFLLQNQKMWSPRHPVLYRFSVTLPDSARSSDHFGFRTFTAHDGRLFLNGKPFYMRAALDQNFFNQGGYTPPSFDFLVKQFELAHRLGLNLLRLHIQIPDPRYLEAADQTGMLVWYEIPSWDQFTPLSAARGKATLETMIQRDWNHPSIVLQSIINESWGADLAQKQDRQWLTSMFRYARAHLPQRLIDDNSPCCRNFHIESDLADFHQYYSIPDHRKAWDQWVKEFAARPKWLFSPYGDAHPTGHEPLIVSEFGNWGLPQLAKPLPWWFDRDFNGNRLTLPGGVFTRYRQAGLPRVFPAYNDLAAATQQHEWISLRHEIESIRLQPSIQGYVITELADTNWESNGLLTSRRQPKQFAAQLAALQQPVVVIARHHRHDYSPGDTAHIRVTVSNESPQPLAGATVHIAGHILPVPTVAPGAVASLPAVTVPITRATTGFQPVAFALAAAGGATISGRVLPLSVVAPLRHGPVAVEVAPSLTGLRAALRADGYRVGNSGVLITATWNQRARQAAAAGRPVIVLADSPFALPADGTWRVVARKGVLSGDWISNFSWLDTSRPPFAAFAPLGSITGWAEAMITPRDLLAGKSASGSPDTLAGFFLGWVHDAHALVVEARHGRGKVLITTFRLAPEYGRDATATAMLDRLIAYVESPACQPAGTL